MRTTTDTDAGKVLPGHGTRARYLHRSHGCKCADCTAANAAYIRHWRAEQRGEHPRAVHPAQLNLWGK